jgi:hypothetical protein
MATDTGRLFVEQTAITSSAEMADFCERRVLEAIQILEENPQHHAGLSEDQITNSVVQMLKAQGIIADHDAMHGGHADILIRHRTFKWVAEAKIFENGSYVWLMKGLLQLTTRYMSSRDQHGGLLIYTYQPRAAAIMKAWRKKMEESKRVSTISDCVRCPDSFHAHTLNKKSGRHAKIWHTIASLHFEPED